VHFAASTSTRPGQPFLEQFEQLPQGVGFGQAPGPDQMPVGIGQGLAGCEDLLFGEPDRVREAEHSGSLAPLVVLGCLAGGAQVLAPSEPSGSSRPSVDGAGSSVPSA